MQRCSFALNKTFPLIYKPFHSIMPFIALMVPHSTTHMYPAVKDTKSADSENDTHIFWRKETKKKNIQEKILCELFLLTPLFRKHKCTKQYTCTVSAYRDQLMAFQCENVAATISQRSPGHQNTEVSQQKGQALVAFLHQSNRKSQILGK